MQQVDALLSCNLLHPAGPLDVPGVDDQKRTPRGSTCNAAELRSLRQILLPWAVDKADTDHVRPACPSLAMEVTLPPLADRRTLQFTAIPSSLPRWCDAYLSENHRNVGDCRVHARRVL